MCLIGKRTCDINVQKHFMYEIFYIGGSDNPVDVPDFFLFKANAICEVLVFMLDLYLLNRFMIFEHR